jgi:hypothetical protein
MPQFSAIQDIDYSTSFNVSFVLRALNMWSLSAVHRDSITIDLVDTLLNAITKSVRMLEPIERVKFVAFMLKSFTKSPKKQVSAFVALFYGLISSYKSRDVSCLWKSIDATLELSSMDTIAEYFVNNVFWFKVERGGLKATKGKLYALKDDLDKLSNRSTRKGGAEKHLFTVTFEAPDGVVTVDEVAGKKRKRKHPSKAGQEYVPMIND